MEWSWCHRCSEQTYLSYAVKLIVPIQSNRSQRAETSKGTYICICICIYINNYLHGICNPEDQCRIHKGSSIISIMSKINPIPRIDTYFFKHHFFRGPPLPPRVTSGIVPIPPGPSQCPILKLYSKLNPTSQFMAWLGYILPLNTSLILSSHIRLGLVLYCIVLYCIVLKEEALGAPYTESV